jgi:energy-coupling factor transporter ATP-binding protein EcfA2
MSDVEARMIGLAVTEPKYAIPHAKRVGMTWSDFKTREHKKIWKELEEMWETGVTIDPSTVKARVGMDGYIDDLADFEGTVDAEAYAKIIVTDAIERDEVNLSHHIQGIAKKKGAGTVLAEIQDEVNRLSARYARMKSPLAQNPAEELENTEGWSTATGLPFLDRLVRLTSGGLHFLAGDPGSGKSTLITHMLAYNARHGVPSVGILAESTPLDIKLAMLTQTQKLSASFASRIRFDPEFRTDSRIERIRELWHDNFEGLPLQIHRVNEGPDAVISLVNSITEPSFVCIDHAFAVVSQGRVRPDGREHQTFMRFFASTEAAAKRNNHVVVMVNQYTKAGREGEERGADAEYGGSGIQNIATTMTHIMQPKSAAEAAVGYRKMTFTIPKCRAMLVVDQHNNPIDPVQRTSDMPGHFWLNVKYRLAEDKLPTLRAEKGERHDQD